MKKTVFLLPVLLIILGVLLFLSKKPVEKNATSVPYTQPSIQKTTPVPTKPPEFTRLDATVVSFNKPTLIVRTDANKIQTFTLLDSIDIQETSSATVAGAVKTNKVTQADLTANQKVVIMTEKATNTVFAILIVK